MDRGVVRWRGKVAADVPQSRGGPALVRVLPNSQQGTWLQTGRKRGKRIKKLKGNGEFQMTRIGKGFQGMLPVRCENIGVEVPWDFFFFCILSSYRTIFGNDTTPKTMTFLLGFSNYTLLVPAS